MCGLGCFFPPPARAAWLRSVLTGRGVGHFGGCGAGHTMCPILGIDSAEKVGVTGCFLHVHSRLWPSEFLGLFSFLCNLNNCFTPICRARVWGEAFYQSFKNV